MFRKVSNLHSLFVRAMSSELRKLEGKVAVVTASTDGLVTQLNCNFVAVHPHCNCYLTALAMP